MKTSYRSLSSVLLLAWTVVLTGPVVPVMQDALQAMSTQHDTGMTCGCSSADLCCCGDDGMACSTTEDADTGNATCVRIPVLFSGVALTTTSFSLVLPIAKERSDMQDQLTPDQIFRTPLDHPPQAA